MQKAPAGDRIEKRFEGCMSFSCIRSVSTDCIAFFPIEGSVGWLSSLCRLAVVALPAVVLPGGRRKMRGMCENEQPTDSRACLAKELILPPQTSLLYSATKTLRCGGVGEACRVAVCATATAKATFLRRRHSHPGLLRSSNLRWTFYSSCRRTQAISWAGRGENEKECD